MPVPILTCTTPYGVYTRQTERTYTHIVQATPSRRNKPLAWCGSLALAQGQQRYWRGRLPDAKVEIFPVDGAVPQIASEDDQERGTR